MARNVSYADAVVRGLQMPAFLHATIGGVPRIAKQTPLVRVEIRSIELKGKRRFQISRFDQRKDITENVLPADLLAALADILAIGFANVHITTADEEIDIRLTKKLDVHVGRRKRTDAPPSAAPEPHNRVKNVPLPEGVADHLLQVMGIMTTDGKIRAAMRGKFTQINEFLKLLDPLVEQLGPKTSENPGISIPGLAPLKILDCGSGSAYLTFAVHHYLNEVRNIPAVLLGIDVNDELIEKSIAKAGHLGAADTLAFTAGRIGQIEDLHPDIVLALHACDTATDDAIAQAVNSEAKIILAVPCCHKHLHGALEIPALKPVHRHGILHQRLADVVTDAFRALILRIMGYRAEVIEFISPEHTARNLMIRAVKTSAAGDRGFIREYLAMKQATGVTPYLDSLVQRVIALPVADGG